MIKLEDKQFEDDIIQSGSHIAMPFEMYVSPHGEIKIISYSFAFDISQKFEKNFAQEPFSEEAKKFLSENLTPIMNELGYDTDGATDRIHIEYRCTDPDKSKILPECEIISSLNGEKWDNIPLDEFELNSELPTDRMAVIKKDGKIVCFAGLNDISEDDGYIEITVECEDKYRMNGYGVSCIAKLTDYLLSLGEKVKYICLDDNLASKSAAESAGFILHDKCLPFVCYKRTEEYASELI